ncbi:MAG: hypothetical protein ACRYFX_06055 [Janthinobacterium lividum]
MSEPAKNAGCLKTAFYVVAAGLGLWLAWHILLMLSSGLGQLSLALFRHLDTSYGRLGGLYGYVLLGLGLGAAAGAVAAQQRFRLNKLILVVAGTAVLLLGSLVFVGATRRHRSTSGSTREQSPPATETSRTTDAPAPEVATATDEAPPEAPDPVAPAEADTTSQPAQGLRRVAVGHVPLRTAWTDSLAAPVAHLQKADTVRLLRRTHHWAQVIKTGADSTDAPTGWVHLAALRPLRARATATKRPPVKLAPTPPQAASEPVAVAPAPTTPVPAHPTGHQKYTGRIGQLTATYLLDWQADGTLSGSYFYDQKPEIVYRLTGALKTNGELHLVEFTRGRQSARCVLQRQAVGYAGTMSNTDGQQFAMSLH